MRPLLIAGTLLLAACSSQKPPGQAARETAAQEPALPSAKVGAVAASGSGLSGQVSSLSGDTSALNVRITDTARIVELPTDTLFAFDKADLAPGAETNLVKVADMIRQSPAGEIRVIGHTDAKGADDYNQKLSERRAEAVAAWLRQQVGVRQRPIVTEGKGEASPVAPNAKADGSDDPEGRARNRRVEVAMPR